MNPDGSSLIITAYLDGLHVNPGKALWDALGDAGFSSESTRTTLKCTRGGVGFRVG